MYKMIKFQWDEEHELSYPADKLTAFYIEGRDAFYTIIDVVSVDKNLYALLENNNLGEEDTPVVFLGNPNQHLLIMENYNRKGINVNLKDRATRIIFIPEAWVILDQAYDHLKECLIEEGLADETVKTIVEWSDEDINKESILQGGIIR